MPYRFFKLYVYNNNVRKYIIVEMSPTVINYPPPFGQRISTSSVYGTKDYLFI